MKRKFRRRVQSSRFRNRPEAEQHRALTAPDDAEPTQWRVVAYGPDEIIEKAQPAIDEIQQLKGRFPVVWVDVSGLGNMAFIESLGAAFQIHPLVMEDVVRTHQRPKMEDYPDALFLVARMAPREDQDCTEQLSVYMTGNCLITVQEYAGDDLDSVRNRIRMKRGRIRNEQVDYLAYAIVDAVVDAYFPIVDHYGELVEQLEDKLVISPTKTLLGEIYRARRTILELRRSIWPHREMLAGLYRGECPLIRDSTAVFFRDCYDHTVQLIDLMENYRELASNLMEVYLSSVSNRLNEIMKVLTIISAVFIPLTFIVGVYGMNFHTDASPWNMPELRAYYGYPICVGIMLLITIGQLVYFQRKGWLRSDDPAVRDAGDKGDAEETNKAVRQDR